MAQYKLTYFNLRFLYGELSRWILSAAGEPWEDIRLDYINKEEWNKLKPKTPYGQLPILEVDGVTISQSNAIARFLARRHGLAGKTEIEQARVDMIVGCIEDASNIGAKVVYETNAEKKTSYQIEFDEKVPGFLEKLEALLKQNKGGDGYFVGDNMTWADIHWAIAKNYLGEVGLNATKYPKLCALTERVQQNPGIAAWLQRRPPPVMDRDV